MAAPSSPIGLLGDIASILEGVGVTWALGGSLASTMYAEPRTTVDIDIVVSLDASDADRLIAALRERYFVPADAAAQAISEHGSFNALDPSSGFKIDFFIASSDLLDVNQLARRRPAQVPGIDQSIWITSAEDLVLRKLTWWRSGGELSDRQWRDVLGILSAQASRLDNAYLNETARALGLSDVLTKAFAQAKTE